MGTKRFRKKVLVLKSDHCGTLWLPNTRSNTSIHPRLLPMKHSASELPPTCCAGDGERASIWLSCSPLAWNTLTYIQFCFCWTVTRSQGTSRLRIHTEKFENGSVETGEPLRKV